MIKGFAGQPRTSRSLIAANVAQIPRKAVLVTIAAIRLRRRATHPVVSPLPGGVLPERTLIPAAMEVAVCWVRPYGPVGR